MKKILLEGLIIVFLFFSTLLVLNQVDWLKLFQVKKNTEKTEEKLGELFWDFFKTTEHENKSTVLLNSMDSIVTKICKRNFIDREYIKLHVLNNSQVNAFALPNGHLVIYTGLIKACENQEELSGVICHELAHIELNHVMQKLINQVGLSVLVSLVTGNNTDIITETAKMLSLTAFDRGLEREADLQSVDYMVRAKINPEPFANLLYKLSVKDHDMMEYLTWISSHPSSKDRAMYVLDYGRDKLLNSEKPILKSTWKKIKSELD